MSAFADQQLAPDRGAGLLAFLLSFVDIRHIICLISHELLHPFKFFYGDDGFVGTLHLGEFNFTVILHFLLFQIILHIFLVVSHDTAVEGIFQDMGNDRGMPFLHALRSFISPPFQLVLDFDQATAIQIHIVDKPDRLSLLRVDDHFLAHTVIAQDVAVSVDHAVVHGSLLTAFHTDRSLAAFILGQSSHDGEPKLTITVECFDAVIDEVHLDTMLPQHSGVLQGVYGVSCEPGNLTGDDHIKLVLPGILHHAHKFRALFCGSAGDTLVDILTDQFPFRVVIQNRLVPVDLIFQRGELGFMLRGHTGIDNDPPPQVFHRVGNHAASSFSL